MIKVKNKELEILIQVMLKKDIKKIELADLDRIEDITLNALDVQGNIISYELTDLKLFRNLKRCMINKYKLTQENLSELNNIGKSNSISELIIHNCEFEKGINLEIKTQTIKFIACKDINIENLISKSEIDNVYILHCINYNIGKINNINIYLCDVNVTGTTCEQLLKGNVKNIVLNNCDYVDVSEKILEELRRKKNLIISNLNKIV